ncbi:hypothetical protein [Nitrolancea hollandica]|uniref:Uncharacterized protein n=1 Tax=Nitrolancea hollandica Lb TaxID=1129897 RepID=I4EL04_9BACT|nr:hypothetical protein [Nitrolancea hollandica]CCF85366.1 hypothetical protein NITHO_4880011 [Nitrolancea hollandica Lb]
MDRFEQQEMERLEEENKGLRLWVGILYILWVFETVLIIDLVR